MVDRHKRKHSFIRHHSLSIVSVGVVILWIVLYNVSNPNTDMGSFFGNAIADWMGVVVMVLATRHLYEQGSAESRRPPHSLLSPMGQRLAQPLAEHFSAHHGNRVGRALFQNGL